VTEKYLFLFCDKQGKGTGNMASYKDITCGISSVDNLPGFLSGDILFKQNHL
jgi:hypothetical protein